MTDVIASTVKLSDSTLKTRPDFGIYFRSDVNGGGNDVQQILQKRRERQMKMPTLSGRHDVDSFQKPTATGFKRFEDDGEFRVAAPFRDFDNVTDPISGFVSAGADVDRRTGVSKIQSFIHVRTDPQHIRPQDVNSIRVGLRGAPPETRRVTEKDPPGPGRWDERLYGSRRMRSDLGGWTSEQDPRQGKPRPPISSVFPEFKRSQTAPELQMRDALAMKYIYTSATQKGYNDIPFDNYLGPKKWSAPTTLEASADPIRSTNPKRYLPKAQDWQALGRAWDSFQTRPDYFNQSRPYTFVSPYPPAQQIPCYSGCVGGDTVLEKDNPSVPFTPYTVKRNVIPAYADTSGRPNIPGYMGCTIYHPRSVPAHANSPQPMPQTTGRVHKPMPVAPNDSEHKHEAPMSKMVTTVPPCNPFNRIEQPETVGQ